MKYNLYNNNSSIIVKRNDQHILILLFVFIFSNCNLNEPTIDKPDTELNWQVISELSNLSVRYILKYNNTLYLSGVEDGVNYRGIIWKTNDGSNWTKVKTFSKSIGPLTIHGDTLYCLGDSLFRYIIPLDIWENVCRPWPLTSDVQAVSEMIFLKNKLYAMQNYTDAPTTYKINFNGMVEEILVKGYSYGGAKFIKKENINDWCYVRGRYHNSGFYIFDGNIFTNQRDGLTDKEWLYPPTNSMEIKNDTLFAGFRFPGLIKYLKNNIWKTFTDTLPFNKEGQNLYYTEPTEITFVNDRMFVSTDALGVLEWTKDSTWIQLSKGLITYSWANDLYHPIVFLESINLTLIAAYGDPGYAPWGGKGVYKYEVKN